MHGGGGSYPPHATSAGSFAALTLDRISASISVFIQMRAIISLVHGITPADLDVRLSLILGTFSSASMITARHGAVHISL